MAVRFDAVRAQPGSAISSIFSILGAVIALGLILAVATPSSAATNTNPRYSALVMNAETGDVLYSRSADSRRYPASLTKVMTLYLLFEAIEEGELTMESELTVSRRAAGQPPSKLGVVAGTTISVSDAIQALAVRSANDVAVVVAEGLAANEWQFSRLMTARAQEMGMDHTRFENASGLPHARQQSTARDLGVMAMHMVNDFPQYLHYFSQREFTYGERTWQTHNHLLENYEGTTGMKTGYIRASGFNLIATVDRNGHSLVGIVMGGRSVVTRDNEMMRLLDLNFGRLNEDPYFGSRVLTSDVRPVWRPDPDSIGDAPVDTLMAVIDLDTAPQLRPSTPIPTALAALPSPVLAPAATPVQETVMAEATIAVTPENNPPAELAQALTESEPEMDTTSFVELAMLETDLRPSFETDLLAATEDEMVLANLPEIIPEATGEAEPFRDVQGSGGPMSWGIHVGAFAMPEEADAQLRAAAVTAPTMLTWGMAAVFPDAESESLQYAAGFGPMTEDDAMDACANLTSTGIACQPIDQMDWDMALRR